MKKCFLYSGFIPVTCIVLAGMLMLAYLGSVTAATVAELDILSRRKTVIIDAGHGLPDGGATSCTGVLECRMNLEIATRLNDLMHLLGAKTYMLRTGDNSVYTQGQTIAAKKISDLKNRVAAVNSMTDSVLVSIHQNHFPDSRYHGPQVFYAETAGSRELAQAVQKELTQHLDPDSRRQCKPANGVYLMQHIQNTGILIECGFISNPREEAKLRSADYQKLLCGVIAGSILRHMQSPAA